MMPWYFNFSSTIGLGMHQYDLPGQPGKSRVRPNARGGCEMGVRVG